MREIRPHCLEPGDIAVLVDSRSDLEAGQPFPCARPGYREADVSRRDVRLGTEYLCIYKAAICQPCKLNHLIIPDTSNSPIWTND